MVSCQICNSEFKNLNALSKHVSAHGMSSKGYYDKFLKTENEGICPITGKQTNYKNMVDGYFKYFGKGLNSKDQHIRNKKSFTMKDKIKNGDIDVEQKIFNYKQTCEKRKELNTARFNFLNVLRQICINTSNKDQCQICGVVFSEREISGHIKIHNINVKEYYDKFFKKEGEGICPISGKETTFISLNEGYRNWHYESNYQSCEEIVLKSKETFLDNFKINILEKQHKYNVEINLEQMKKNTDWVDVKCLSCSHVYSNSWYNINLGYGKCPKCYPVDNSSSKAEKEIKRFIKSQFDEKTQIWYNYKHLIKNENGRQLELDIYIPTLNLAFEYNGLYWHSDKIKSDPVNIHILKTNLCKEKNVRLIHIFEDEWLYKKDIVKNKILNLIGKNKSIKLHARKCFIREINSFDKNIFLEKYHIQGKDYSKIKLGAFYDDELVSVMTFSLGNISRGGDPTNTKKWELSRFCTSDKYLVRGIASKLLKYFENNYTWEEIYSYADMRWSTGNMYYLLGFNIDHISKPDYWYVKNSERIHRFRLRKRKDEPKNITEWELRSQEGYSKIWDCGKIKFSKK